MFGWHHRLNGHQFEQALGVGDGQGSLACCSPWGHKESDLTEQLTEQDCQPLKGRDFVFSATQGTSSILFANWTQQTLNKYLHNVVLWAKSDMIPDFMALATQ